MKISEEFLKFCSNFSNKFFKILQNILWVHFCWMSLQTEILATPLQYRTWVEFMCEILSAVPPQPTTILRRPWFSSWYYNFSRWIYWHFCIQFCSWIKFYSVIFCIFCGILYFTTFLKKIRFPWVKILEPPLINISLKLYYSKRGISDRIFQN